MIRIDPESGRSAALWALRSRDTPDRHRYPYLLVSALGEAVAADLLDHLRTESDSVVKAAIGRALSRISIDESIERRLSSSGEGDRLAGCISAGWAGRSDRLPELLNRLLSAPDRRVQEEASRALTRIRQRAETEALAQGVIETDDHFARWLYLDALVEFSDPGDAYDLWPVGGPAIGNCLSPLQQKHVKKRLDWRRKEIFNSLRRSE